MVSGFQQATKKKLERILFHVWGDTGTGKTHFALTCPPPVYVLNLDRPLDELTNQFEGKEIFFKDYVILDEDGNPVLQPTVRQMSTLLIDFANDYKALLTELSEGTIVIDTGTQLWQMIQVVKLNDIRIEREKKGKEVYPFDYAEANHNYQGFLNAIKPKNKLNLVLISRQKECYNESGNPSGFFEPQDNRTASYLTQIVLRTKKVGKEYHAIVTKCTPRPEWEGTDIVNPSYDEIVQMILP